MVYGAKENLRDFTLVPPKTGQDKVHTAEMSINLYKYLNCKQRLILIFAVFEAFPLVMLRSSLGRLQFYVGLAC